MAQARVIQVLARSEAEQVAKLGFAQTALIPNGISAQAFANLPDRSLFYQHFSHLRHKTLILFLGRIDPKKGLDVLALAFAKVNRLFPHTHLVVAGPDSIHFTETAKSYFAKAQCLRAVTFTGMLSGDLKYAALAAAQLYVSPSYSEGFSMSVLEGMAAGLPCVITENCNFPEAKTANAAFVVSAQAQAIGEALIACLQHPLQAQQMGSRAKAFVHQNYTWESAAQKLLATYCAMSDGKKVSENAPIRNAV